LQNNDIQFANCTFIGQFYRHSNPRKEQRASSAGILNDVANHLNSQANFADAAILSAANGFTGDDSVTQSRAVDLQIGSNYPSPRLVVFANCEK
jgi:hypothetical protein